MTSLKFFRPQGPKERGARLEWGTGKPKEQIDLAVPRNPTWRTTGVPDIQHYQLTQLKLSNVRDNDELIPKPQAIDIGRETIDLPFPAEHPLTSHTPRYAVFPKFDSTEDPKRGVAARSQIPITSEMPSNPFDVIVKQPIQGFPYRHEFQDCPPEVQRKPLYWPGEDFFDQPNKIHGNTQRYYPAPPKLICPNLQDRSGAAAGGGPGGGAPLAARPRPDLSVSVRTANTLRNVERDQWQTTYQVNYTGLGPANPKELDNWQQKQEKLRRTGIEDDTLYPCSQNTFDPSLPVNGRLPRNVRPLPIHQPSLVTDTIYDTQYRRYRDPTPKERAEHRLLYGADYLNLPDTSGDPGPDLTWQQVDTAARAGPCLEQVEKAKEGSRQTAVGTDGCYSSSSATATPGDEAPLSIHHHRTPTQENPYPTIGMPRYPEEEPLPQAKVKQDEDIQQLEAQNRWQDLENQTTLRDMQALRHKMHKLPLEDQPATFYKHEGRYNEERAGLYKTSYDPHVLSGTMNADAEAPSNLTYTLDSNLQSQFNVSLPAARLNEDVNAALKWSRTFSLSKPELSGDRREGPEVMQTWNQLKSSQRGRLLPPAPDQACPRVQEREVLEREATSMGRGYNVKKFLQQNNLHPRARDDPYTLMSAGNQNLHRVRTQTFQRPAKKSVQFHPSVSVRTLPEDCSSSTTTPSTRVEAQLRDIPEPPLPAPPLSLEDKNLPKLIPRYPEFVPPEKPHVSASPPPPPQPPPQPQQQPPQPQQQQPPRADQDFFSETSRTYDDGRVERTTIHTMRHSDPATPEAETRRVYFDENANSNNNADEREAESPRSTTDRYRCFPRRLPGASHGHGLLDSEYTGQYLGYLDSSASSLPPFSKRARPAPDPSKFPNLDLGVKDDARFQWQPGKGVPRPQTTLLKIQDSFSKTEAIQKFHRDFPETHPELNSSSICKGRRHEFWGFNSKTMHG